MNRFLSEVEISPCLLFGIEILPRYSFVSAKYWFSYLKQLNIEELNQAFLILDKYDENSTLYRYLSSMLYEYLISKCELPKPRKEAKQ